MLKQALLLGVGRPAVLNFVRWGYWSAQLKTGFKMMMLPFSFELLNPRSRMAFYFVVLLAHPPARLGSLPIVTHGHHQVYPQGVLVVRECVHIRPYLSSS